jgi:predicted nucleic acid-binding protein
VIVADANLLVYLTVPGPRSELARQALARDPEWKAPRFWRVEFRNAVLKHIRAGDLTVDEALECFEDASELVGEEESEPNARAVLEIAVTHGISAYDAEYVAAARDLGVRVVSADLALVGAVPEMVVSLEDFAAGA